VGQAIALGFSHGWVASVRLARGDVHDLAENKANLRKLLILEARAPRWKEWVEPEQQQQQHQQQQQGLIFQQQQQQWQQFEHLQSEQQQHK
jgi:hypothetical protein